MNTLNRLIEQTANGRHRRGLFVHTGWVEGNENREVNKIHSEELMSFTICCNSWSRLRASRGVN